MRDILHMFNKNENIAIKLYISTGFIKIHRINDNYENKLIVKLIIKY